MKSEVVLASGVVRENGNGTAVALKDLRGRPLTLVLDISRVLPYKSLQVSIWGSSSALHEPWKRLAIFPLRSYCGTYLLNLLPAQDVQYLRAQWAMEAWTGSPVGSVFEFSLCLTSAPEKIAPQSAHRVATSAIA